MYSTHLASHVVHGQRTWLSGEPECIWFGITCTKTQIFVTNKIISIDLPGTYLKGSIPNALVFHLDSLEELYLENNVLTGTIPTEIGTLSNLIKLSLNSNNLEGTIPSEIGQITTLVQITLSFNDLTQNIPLEFAMLSKLDLLNVWANPLSGEVPLEVFVHPNLHVTVASLVSNQSGNLFLHISIQDKLLKIATFIL
eukprot:scaffold3281_cov55-Attheya_sp.AAC.1